LWKIIIFLLEESGKSRFFDGNLTILNGICSGFLLGSSTSFHEKIISQSWNIIHILRGNHNVSSTQELHLTMLTTMCHLDSHGRKFPGQAAIAMLPS
jgi:hypothetical protein